MVSPNDGEEAVGLDEVAQRPGRFCRLGIAGSVDLNVEIWFPRTGR